MRKIFLNNLFNFLIHFHVYNVDITEPVCDYNSFLFFEDHLTYGARRAFQYKSDIDCLNACIRNYARTCYAIDFNHKETKCYHHIEKPLTTAPSVFVTRDQYRRWCNSKSIVNLYINGIIIR